MKTLCIYYTRSGLTKDIAAYIAERLDAELLEITDGKDRSGLWGYVVAAVAGLSKKLPALQPFTTLLPLAEYDRIIAAAPVWCEDVCPVMRAFFNDHKSEMHGGIHFVLTHMSDITYDTKIAKLETAFGKKFDSAVSVRTKDHDWSGEIDEFIKDMEK